MRGADSYNESLFTTVKLEDFVPANHPLRPIRTWVNGKRAGNTPRELEAAQRKAAGCQRCGSSSSIRPAGCSGNRVSTSLM